MTGWASSRRGHLVGLAVLALGLVVGPAEATGIGSRQTETSATSATSAPSAALAPIAAQPAADTQPAVALSATGRVLSLSGEPLVHTFDTTVAGDQVEGVWTLTNAGAHRVGYDGALEPVGEYSPELAAGVLVEYGVLADDGRLALWASAGTLAGPVPYSTATGVSPVVEGRTTVSVPVRLTLGGIAALHASPSLSHTVRATFSVTSLASTEGTPVGPGHGPLPGLGSVLGALASTGPSLGLWLVTALAATALGAHLRRRRARGAARVSSP